MTLLFGCSKAGIQIKEVYQNGRDYVHLAYETDKEGAIVPKEFEHPATISPEKMDIALTQVQYSVYSFFKWRKSSPVFIESERKKLAGPLALAFEAADKDHWVKFAVTAKKRDMLLSTRRLTTGYMFIKDDKLNIILGNLNHEITDTDDPYSGDPRNRTSLNGLKLDDGPNVTIVEPNKDDPFLKRPHHNWVLVDLKSIDQIKAVEIQKEESVVPQQPVEEKTIEQRLEELKALLDKGLITQEDYEKKKEELLKQL